MVIARNLMPYAPFAGALLSEIAGLRAGPKTQYSKSSTRTTTRTKRKPKTTASVVKKIINNDKPAKHKTQYAATALLHNGIYCLSPTQLVVQGDTNQDRDGDQIQLAALKIHGTIWTDTAASMYNYRILVGYSGEEYNLSAGTWSASALIEAEIFLPATGAGHRTAAIVNPKAFTCLYDQVIDLESQITGAVNGNSYSMTVPLGNQKFNYQSTASIYGKSRSLYIIVIPCVYAGTLGITAVGNLQMSFDLIFK